MQRGLAILVGSLMACVGLLGQGLAEPAGISREGGALVPPEEYPVFDTIVESKFLTSQTRIVVIERATVRRLHPEVDALPTVDWFDAARPFDGRLPADLVTDFVVKNQRPARLEHRFRFGVSVRFVTPEGLPEPEVRLAPRLKPGSPRLVQRDPQGPPRTLDRLAFSRAGFNLREDQALVYVANERPAGDGAGFLMWLQRQGGAWTFIDTDVLWTARPVEEERSRR